VSKKYLPNEGKPGARQDFAGRLLCEKGEWREGTDTSSLKTKERVRNLQRESQQTLV
jgi:hypothetical protein